MTHQENAPHEVMKSRTHFLAIASHFCCHLYTVHSAVGLSSDVGPAGKELTKEHGMWKPEEEIVR